MQELHLVGFTTEHDALIFSARKGAKSGGFLVALDDTLCDTIDEAVRMRDGGDEDAGGGRRGRKGRTSSIPRPESALSPRDIQMRLRAGRSIGSVASEAGVDEEWIMRFAVPILAEQALVVARAQNMVFAKARLGESGRPLGESVWWNIADKGALMAADTFDQCWSAQHLRDSIWVVRFEFVNRKKRQRAEWEVDTRERTIHGRNRLASELGYVEPGRRGRPPAPLPPVAKPAAAKATATKRTSSKRSGPIRVIPVKRRATASKATKKKAAAKKKAAPAKKRAPAKKPTAKKRAPAKRPTAKKRAPAKKAPAKRPATKRTASKRAPARKAPAKKATRRPTPTRAVTKKAAPTKAKKAVRRPPAKKKSASRTRPAPAPVEVFETPALEPGDATRPVTIRAALAAAPEPEPVEGNGDVATPVSSPVPVLSTPAPTGSRPAPPTPRRFGRLRRRRPPGS